MNLYSQETGITYEQELQTQEESNVVASSTYGTSGSTIVIASC